MNDVCVLLRENGAVRASRVRKTLLNAFHDVRWYTPAPAAHPFQAIFDTPAPSANPFGYGLVVLDRDTRWVGSCQGYMALGTWEAFTDGGRLRHLAQWDLEAQVVEWGPKGWAGLLGHPDTRVRQLLDAYAGGAIARVRTGALGEPAPWQSLETLGLHDVFSAADWLSARRREITGGRCLLTQCAFEFAPPGWTIEDFDPDTGARAFAEALAARGLVPAMSDNEASRWWQARLEEGR